MKRHIRKAINRLSDIYFTFNKDEKWDQYYLYNTKTERGFAFDEYSLPSSVIEKYKASLDWNGEFCYYYPYKCLIEPTLGYAIAGKRTLIKESLWHRYVHPTLSKPNCVRYLMNQKTSQKIKLKSAIILQYGAANYWHFYNDFLGALCLADELGLDKQMPILVPSLLYGQNFFREFLSISPELQSRNWIFQQPNEYFEVENSYFLVIAHA